MAFVLSWVQVVKRLGFICAVSVLLKGLVKCRLNLFRYSSTKQFKRNENKFPPDILQIENLRMH